MQVQLDEIDPDQNSTIESYLQSCYDQLPLCQTQSINKLSVLLQKFTLILYKGINIRWFSSFIVFINNAGDETFLLRLTSLCTFLLTILFYKKMSRFKTHYIKYIITSLCCLLYICICRWHCFYCLRSCFQLYFQKKLVWFVNVDFFISFKILYYFNHQLALMWVKKMLLLKFCYSSVQCLWLNIYSLKE